VCTAAAAGGTRLQDELQITITKALSHSHPGYKRIGVVGSLALLRQQAAEHDLMADAQGTAAGAAQHRSATSCTEQCVWPLRCQQHVYLL
jgi:hypothetical protein